MHFAPLHFCLLCSAGKIVGTSGLRTVILDTIITLSLSTQLVLKLQLQVNQVEGCQLCNANFEHCEL